MKLFECQQCGQLLYFENTKCERCGHVLGYLPEQTTLSALVPKGGDRWSPMATPDRESRFCANAQHEACNWLVPTNSDDAFCQACRLNHMIPDLRFEQNLMRWRLLESAKRRLIYGLLRLRLPISGKQQDPAGLAFDFLADPESGLGDGQPVITGHADGLITINVAEADDAERERRRQNMAEPYRTLLGHMRHEVGHFYWEKLVSGGGWLDRFRTMFGDEREDYDRSLERHYAQGSPVDWPQRFVSSYATAHPWEDWAETWAHYLHLADTLETAQAFNLRVCPNVGVNPALAADASFDPYRFDDFDLMVRTWLPVTSAVNSLNRSMGQPDLYPFVLAPIVVDKLRFVHDLILEKGEAH